jgi:chromosome segregation protein
MKELGSLVMSASNRLKGIYEELAGLQEIEAPSAIKELEGAYSLATERAKSCEAIHSRVASELTDAERRLRRLEEELARSQGVQEEEKAKLKEIGLEWKRLRERRVVLRGLVEASDEMLALMAKKVTGARRRAEAAEKDKETLARSLQSIEERKGSAERELERIVDLWEGNFPYSEADAASIAEPAEALRRSALQLEEELRSFGDVDYGVLSEDNSLSQRISYLGLELKDVLDGKRELEELIRLTDRQAGDVFKGALKKIDVRFDELFRLLLGGGEAHLRLEEGVSLWDAGVEVICRPPGKRAQHLSQLSGGERSLSAIAFLLAAMDEANAPLAVLDEVDASLDEVNVRRFADLLCEYAKKIQLIIMTHRRVTMEGADVIYGVTLSEPGLSQVVGVQLEEWV